MRILRPQTGCTESVHRRLLGKWRRADRRLPPRREGRGAPAQWLTRARSQHAHSGSYRCHENWAGADAHRVDENVVSVCTTFLGRGNEIDQQDRIFYHDAGQQAQLGVYGLSNYRPK